MADHSRGAVAPPGVRIPPTSIPERCEARTHVLLWQVRGDAEVVLADGDRTVRAGHALWIPSGIRHRLTVHADSVTMPLFFDAGVGTSLREPTLLAVDRDLRTLMLAHVVSSTTVIKPPTDLARQILTRLEGRPPLPTGLPMPTGDPARRIAEGLRADPGDLRSIEELARSVHTSTRTLGRAFLTETGMTLRQWRIRNRMDAAARLLRTEATVDAVAHRVGYTNVNAFRRVFAGRFDLSPTEYLRRYRAQ